MGWPTQYEHLVTEQRPINGITCPVCGGQHLSIEWSNSDLRCVSGLLWWSAWQRRASCAYVHSRLGHCKLRTLFMLHRLLAHTALHCR